jgi:hypothetical protein
MTTAFHILISQCKILPVFILCVCVRVWPALQRQRVLKDCKEKENAAIFSWIQAVVFHFVPFLHSVHKVIAECRCHFRPQVLPPEQLNRLNAAR